MTANRACTATFNLRSFSVNFSIEGSGTLSETVSQAIPYGGSTTPVSAQANGGSRFVEWSVSGAGPPTTTTTTVNPLTITNVQADLSVQAHFVPLQYLLTANASGSGWGGSHLQYRRLQCDRRDSDHGQLRHILHGC